MLLKEPVDIPDILELRKREAALAPHHWGPHSVKEERLSSISLAFRAVLVPATRSLNTSSWRQFVPAYVALATSAFFPCSSKLEDFCLLE